MEAALWGHCENVKNLLGVTRTRTSRTVVASKPFILWILLIETRNNATGAQEEITKSTKRSPVHPIKHGG